MRQPAGSNRPLVPQTRVMTSVTDSVWAGACLAAWLMESDTTQAAPAMAMLMALPAQLKWLRGSRWRFGIQNKNSKIAISTVSRREASGAMMPVRMATAAAKKPSVVA